MPVSLTPSLVGLAGPAYFVVALVLGLAFLFFSLRFAVRRTRRDARTLFLASIAYLPLVWIAMIPTRQPLNRPGITPESPLCLASPISQRSTRP